MAAVRGTVNRVWTTALQLVHGPERAIPETACKLLRPALCLLSAGAIGGRSAGGHAGGDLHRFTELATAFEVLHLAALVHDDVIDKADTRRGMTSLNVLWDDHSAVLGGDYLVAQATALMTPYDSCELIADVAESVQQMAGGELRSLGRAPAAFTERDCIRLAREKTASLFASTCTAPSFLLDTPHRPALHRYGTGFGIAFQLVDDLLDLTQPETALGKPSCGDITEGKATLPILTMRARLEPDERARLDAMTGRDISDTDRSWVAAMCDKTGAGEYTEDTARGYLNNARRALHNLPASQYRRSMDGLLDFVLTRGA